MPNPPGTRASLRVSPRIGALLLAVVLAGIAVHGYALLARYQTPVFLFDDSFMFVRYARNFWSGDGFAWNPSGPPTYGCTSVWFLLLTTVTLKWFADPSLQLTVLSVTGGLACIAAIAWASRALVESWANVTLGLGVAFGLALWPRGANRFLPVWFTGMDTTWAVAYLALWFGMLWYRKSGVWLGFVGAFAFWARPELLIFTIGVPVVLLLIDKSERRRMLVTLLSGAIVGSGLLLFNLALFQSWVPLPFYGKVTGGYEDFNFAVYNAEIRAKLLWFASQIGGAILVLTVGMGFVIRQREPLRRDWLASAGMAVVFGWFITTQVTQTMGHHGRFYWPLWPVVAAGVVYVLPRIPIPDKGWLVAVGLVVGIGVIDEIRTTNLTGPLTRFSTGANYEQQRLATWPGLRGIPPGSVIATTEVGHPGALLPAVHIIDMAGLNDRTFAIKRDAAEQMFRNRAPDVLYIPHRDYRGMIRRIIASEALRQDYEYFDPPELRLPLPVAVRRDWKHRGQFVEQLKNDFTTIASPSYNRGKIFREANEVTQ